MHWLRANILSLSYPYSHLILNKADYFLSAKKKYQYTIDIKLNNYLLKPVNNVTYLGLERDKVLSWDKQTETL